MIGILIYPYRRIGQMMLSNQVNENLSKLSNRNDLQKFKTKYVKMVTINLSYEHEHQLGVWLSHYNAHS